MFVKSFAFPLYELSFFLPEEACSSKPSKWPPFAAISS
jgi:hypothetical protein